MTVKANNEGILFNDSTYQVTAGAETATNLGAGQGIFANISSDGSARFKRLVANGSLALTSNSTHILFTFTTISNPGPPGPPGPDGPPG